MAARRWAAGVLTASMVVWGIAALGGGFGLAGSPDGSAMNFETGWLRNTPFDDWLVPGLLLMTVGVVSLGAAAVLWRALRRPRSPSGPGWWFVLAVAVGQGAWIIGEIVLLWAPVSGTDASVRQFFYGFWIVYLPWGLLDLWLALRPSVRSLFR